MRGPSRILQRSSRFWQRSVRICKDLWESYQDPEDFNNNLWGSYKDQQRYSKICEDLAKICEDLAKICKDLAKICKDHTKICKDHTKICKDLAKIFKDFTKIFKISAKILKIHAKTFKDPWRSSRDPQGSWQEFWRSLKIFEDFVQRSSKICTRIFMQIFKDLQRSLKVFHQGNPKERPPSIQRLLFKIPIFLTVNFCKLDLY